jgi:hypothetical protein
MKIHREKKKYDKLIQLLTLRIKKINNMFKYTVYFCNYLFFVDAKQVKYAYKMELPMEQLKFT